MLFVLMFLLAVPSVLAQTGNMKLLAVTETANGSEGLLADLHLEIRPGTGNVFVDTFPISKIDTLMSIRLAKQIACKGLDKDCSGLDFVYTIRAIAGIVGGPSAGAAATVLTMALLEEQQINESIAITGTINAGGIIGPVSALGAKIDAAKFGNLSLVLLPLDIILLENKTEVSIEEYAQRADIALKHVTNIDDAYFYFTGIKREKPEVALTLDPFYASIMKDVAQGLCTRTDALQQAFLTTRPVIEVGEDILTRENNTKNAQSY